MGVSRCIGDCRRSEISCLIIEAYRVQTRTNTSENIDLISGRPTLSILSSSLAFLLAPYALAQHQTTTLTPLTPGGANDFRISLREYDFGSAPIAGLHSFASGVVDGKWVILSG